MSYSRQTVEGSYDILLDAQERAEAIKNYSKQQKGKGTSFSSFLDFYKNHLSERQLYDYKPDSRQRDGWLRSLWKKEPHLAGVLNSAVAIDKNRNWTLTGTQRQVVLYNNILRHADDNQGWREFVSVASESFYSADISALVEVGRQGRIGPMRGLYNVDPTKARLTGDRNYPLEFFPLNGKPQKWFWSDFFRVAAMPTTDDKFHRLGFSAVSRCVELVSLLLSVYEYDQE